MILSHVDVEGKHLVFTLRGTGVCKPWQQALTVVQIGFFGVNDNKLFFFYHDRTQKWYCS